MASQPIIETHALRRDFKAVCAVDSLDLKVDAGELFGLVGPDGAGKTTTLRLLAGLLSISSGSASIAGFDLGRQAESIKPHVGYMAQQFSLYAELSVLENLHFFADIFQVAPADIASRVERLLGFAGLVDFRDRRAGNLSGGMQKILVSTPYMDEADRCSIVGLMYAGRMMVCDTPQHIRAPLEGQVIELQPDDWQAAQALVAQLPGVHEVQTYGESLHLLVDSGAKRLPEIERALKAKRLSYRTARLAPARMEEAFITRIRQLQEG
jgi:ABC-2 type transport system ATP-binding protein